MKFLTLAFVAICSLSTFAQSPLIEDLVKEKDCFVQVLDPAIIERGLLGVFFGNFSLEAHKKDINVNRRVNNGRLIKVMRIENGIFHFKDSHLNVGCLVGQDRRCKRTDTLSVMEFHYESAQKLRFICDEFPTIDI